MAVENDVGHFELSPEQQDRMEYHLEVTKLIESIKPAYQNQRHHKLKFDRFGSVVGLDTTKDFDELMLEKDIRREERKKRRLDERRAIIERGGELTDPDEEIDGYTSVSSIPSESRAEIAEQQRLEEFNRKQE